MHNFSISTGQKSFMGYVSCQKYWAPSVQSFRCLLDTTNNKQTDREAEYICIFLLIQIYIKMLNWTLMLDTLNSDTLISISSVDTFNFISDIPPECNYHAGYRIKIRLGRRLRINLNIYITRVPTSGVFKKCQLLQAQQILTKEY